MLDSLYTVTFITLYALFTGKEKDIKKKGRKKVRDLNEKGMKKVGSDMDAFTDQKVGLATTLRLCCSVPWATLHT